MVIRIINLLLRKLFPGVFHFFQVFDSGHVQNLARVEDLAFLVTNRPQLIDHIRILLLFTAAWQPLDRRLLFLRVKVSIFAG